MICLASTIGVDWEHTAMDELFAELQQAGSNSERQVIVCKALRDGVDQDELREMLDYLESFGDARSREIPSPKGRKRTAHAKGNWASYLSGLIYRYR